MNRRIIKDYKYLAFFIASLWIIEVVNYLLNHSLNQFALVPRDLPHLGGILTMHFLHWNFNHLIANSLPLLVMGFFVASIGRGLKVTLFIIFASGTLLWLLGRSGVHAGASALVMGYWGYLISHAYFERSLKSLLISVATIIVYGGLAATLIDFGASVSVEGHAFGFISGVFSAWYYSRGSRR